MFIILLLNIYPLVFCNLVEYNKCYSQVRSSCNTLSYTLIFSEKLLSHKYLHFFTVIYLLHNSFIILIYKSHAESEFF